MSARLDFVKGHCGWDVVTLLPEGQIPATDELAVSLKILSAPIDGGLEVGWLGGGCRPGEIRLRMVNSTTRTWIPMCGGMTQVIGKALIETFFRELFNIDTSQSVLLVTLITPSGGIPIRVESRNGHVLRVTTTMDNYLAGAYHAGVEPLLLEGVPVLRVGKYAVIDVVALESIHPDVDFTRRDPGRHLDIVNDVLRAFRHRLGVTGVNGMLYDERPEGQGQYRVFPRFYSDDLAAARIPWEFQCGTGSVVVAMTLAHEGRLPFRTQRGEVSLEWGSNRVTRDPYGIRMSQLYLDLTGKRVTKASFSHSVVEIIAEGKLTLPSYLGVVIK
jgi:hypothetical protein